MFATPSRRTALLVGGALLALAGCGKADTTTTAAADGAAPPAAGADDPKQIALDAYVYGYSLLTTEVTRLQMSNVPKQMGLQSPMGMFTNVPRYPPADYRGVSAPNADTLYSVAWVDLSQPMVFSRPDMGTRFHLFEMVDLWMTIIKSPGSREFGGKAMNFLLTGPDFKGPVPEGMTQIAFPSRYMVILGRTYADGTDADYKIVNALQAQLKLTPLASFGKPFTPVAPPVTDAGISMTDKPQQVILDMGTDGYFQRMADLMCKTAPPAAEDAPIIARMAKIGIEPCKYDPSKMPAEVKPTLPQDGIKLIEANKDKMGAMVNGWVISKGLGRYGTDYMKRAVVAAFGWPANLQDDAVYPYTEIDSSGAELTGANKYTLTFAKGQTPPVGGFWSITMYMIDGGWWFVPNPLNKFTVSPRNNLKANADGSITLYFQAESPGKDKESNWLPAPKGKFIPMMRLYGPNQTPPTILDGSWAPPKVEKVG
jgi:hypothetical protein